MSHSFLFQFVLSKPNYRSTIGREIFTVENFPLFHGSTDHATISLLSKTPTCALNKISGGRDGGAWKATEYIHPVFSRYFKMDVWAMCHVNCVSVLIEFTNAKINWPWKFQILWHLTVTAYRPYTMIMTSCPPECHFYPHTVPLQGWICTACMSKSCHMAYTDSPSACPYTTYTALTTHHYVC